MASRQLHAYSTLHTLHALVLAVPAAQNIFSRAPVDLKQGLKSSLFAIYVLLLLACLPPPRVLTGPEPCLSITVTSASSMSEHQMSAH